MSAVLARHIETVWALDPTANAIEYNGKWHNWGELHAAALAIDAALTKAGISAGAPVGVLLRNRPGLLATLLCLLVTDRCIVSLSPFQPDTGLQEDIRNLNLAAVVGDSRDLSAEVQTTAKETGSVVLVMPEGALAGFIRSGNVAGRDGFPPYEDFSGTALEILTSGTTGKPKRIRISTSTMADSIIDGATASGRIKTLTLKTTPTVLFAPLMHVSGMFGALTSIFEGRPIVLLDKFTVEGWADAVERYSVKFSSLPPTPMRMVLDAKLPKEKLQSLVAVRAGTAPLPPATQKAFEDCYGIPVLIQYGATEWMGGLAGWTLEDHKKFIATKLGSVGRPRGDLQMRITDADTGAEVPVGQPGILEVLPRQRLGADATWTRTTDVASIDADGFLYIHGRADDTIIRGGFKVQLTHVAEALQKHQAVLEAAVIGLPDARLGQVPVAAVELKPGAELTPEALKQFAQAHLTAYQVPVKFKIVESLPRTVSLKVSRPDVRALFTE
jgi:acyl-CoA synthetase (AMP-forming)/AMP-acid ligase II